MAGIYTNMTYHVRRGDTLSSIALEAYGDAKYWLKLKEVNFDVVGPNDEIYIGTGIMIPDLQNRSYDKPINQAKEPKRTIQYGSFASGGQHESIAAPLPAISMEKDFTIFEYMFVGPGATVKVKCTASGEATFLTNKTMANVCSLSATNLSATCSSSIRGFISEFGINIHNESSGTLKHTWSNEMYNFTISMSAPNKFTGTVDLKDGKVLQKNDLVVKLNCIIKVEIEIFPQAQPVKVTSPQEELQAYKLMHLRLNNPTLRYLATGTVMVVGIAAFVALLPIEAVAALGTAGVAGISWLAAEKTPKYQSLEEAPVTL